MYNGIVTKRQKGGNIMAFLKVFLPMLLMVVVILLIYNVLKIYVLENIQVNKWVILVIAAVIFAAPNLIWPGKIKGIIQYIQTGIFLIFFLWFMDLVGMSGRRSAKKEDTKNTVIKTKAKPNRVKNNNDMEVIPKGKKKKKK